MSIRKGVVLEIDGLEAIILSDSGEFIRVPVRKRQLEVGMEITLPSRRKSKTFQMRSLTGWVAAAAAVLLMVFSPLTGLFNFSGDEVVGYVSIDINPSIELTINSNEDVVAAEPFNADGRKVLSEVNVRGKEMEVAAALITKQAIKDGFLGPKASNSVMLALTPAQGETISASWETSLKASVSGVLQEEHQVASVDTMIGSQELRMSAKEQGLSVGKFAVLLAAKEKNVPITVAEVKQKSITEIIQGKGAEVADLIKTKHTSEDWDVIAAKFDDKLDDGTQVAVAGQVGGTSEELKETTDTGSAKPGTKTTVKPTTAGDQETNPPGMATITSFRHQDTSTKTPEKTAAGGTEPATSGEQTGTEPEETVTDKVYAPKEDASADNTGVNTKTESEPTPNLVP